MQLRLPVIQIILLLLINSSCVKKDPMEVSLGNTPMRPLYNPVRILKENTSLLATLIL
jgi:hypothetical protein